MKVRRQVIPYAQPLSSSTLLVWFFNRDGKVKGWAGETMQIVSNTILHALINALDFSTFRLIRERKS